MGLGRNNNEGIDPHSGKGRKSIDSVCCSICLETVVDNGLRSSSKLQCGHRFHLDCIASAFNLKGSMQCPNCRETKEGEWLYSDGSGSSTKFSIHEVICNFSYFIERAKHELFEDQKLQSARVDDLEAQLRATQEKTTQDLTRLWSVLVDVGAVSPNMVPPEFAVKGSSAQDQPLTVRPLSLQIRPDSTSSEPVDEGIVDLNVTTNN